MSIVTQYNIKNEVILSLIYGSRYDFTHVAGTASQKTIQMLDFPPEITAVTITVYAQKNGDIIQSWAIGPQGASNEFNWNISDTDLAGKKPLNYWVEAVDQDKQILFYGSFTLL
jgi:hypothetical protein